MTNPEKVAPPPDSGQEEIRRIAFEALRILGTKSNAPQSTREEFKKELAGQEEAVQRLVREVLYYERMPKSPTGGRFMRVPETTFREIRPDDSIVLTENALGDNGPIDPVRIVMDFEAQQEQDSKQREDS